MDKTLEVTVPLVPNFIKVGSTMLCISEFTDKELEQLSKLWLEALLQRKYTIVHNKLNDAATRTKRRKA